MTRWVGLLRGINVGGKNRVPMAGLRELATQIGLENVSTYIQSGNLVFDSDETEIEAAGKIRQAVTERFDLEVPIVLRDAESFRAAASSHPFSDNEDDQRFLVVAFLDSEPSTYPTDALPRAEFAPDRYAYSDREVYIHYPNGSARSKLTSDIIDRRLGVTSTLRNWRTVLKLASMLDA